MRRRLREAQRELLRLEFRRPHGLVRSRPISAAGGGRKVADVGEQSGELRSWPTMTQRIEGAKVPPAAIGGDLVVPAILPRRGKRGTRLRGMGGSAGSGTSIACSWASSPGWRPGWVGDHVTRRRAESSDVLTRPEPLVDPQRRGKRRSRRCRFRVEPEVLGTSSPVDLPSIPEGEAPAPPVQVQPAPRNNLDLAFSVSRQRSTSTEVNPVMELAEIMLSFGRVKGCPALQEYIDQSPKEALQPG